MVERPESFAETRKTIRFDSPLMKEVESKYSLRKKDIPGDLRRKMQSRLAAARFERNEDNFAREVSLPHCAAISETGY